MNTATATNRISSTNGRKTVIPRLEDMDVTKPFAGQVVISPDAAQCVLPQNVGNRRVRNSFVINLTAQIRDGEWQSDHPQPMVWSDRGTFIDGQHRILAIIEAGIEVIANVVFGVRFELREYIDTGISRKLEDRCSFVDNLRINQACSQIINQMYMYVRTGGKYATKPSPSVAWDIFEKHKAAIIFAAEFMSAKKQKGVTRAPVMVAVAEFFEKDQEGAREFLNSLSRDSGEIQPATMLRLFLLRFTGNGGNMASIEIRGKAICAMKAFQEGRELKNLRMSDW